jgi:hypothetical protein
MFSGSILFRPNFAPLSAINAAIQRLPIPLSTAW